MRKRSLATTGLLSLFAACTHIAVRPTEPADQPLSLDATLQPYIARYGLPALAAAVVQDGKIVAAGAVGTRKAGEQIPVTQELYGRFGGTGARSAADWGAREIASLSVCESFCVD